MTPIADVGASIAEAVPILGAPFKGSLDALTKTLKLIEQRFQNHECIDGLLQKLREVKKNVERFPGSENVEWLNSGLECIEQDLNKLVAASTLDYGHVSTTISQCEKDVSFFLSQFSAMGHVETQSLLHSKHERTIAELEAVKAELAHHREHGEVVNTKLALIFETLQIPAKGRDVISVTIIDPFGIEQRIVQIPHTLADLGRLMLDKYRRNPKMQKALEGFVAKNQFELSLDDDRQVFPLHEQDLHTLEPDSTVVMSVVVFSDITVDGVKCPLCKAFIPLAEKNARVLCRWCDKNVQVSQEEQPVRESGDRVRATSPQEDFQSLQQIVIKASRLSPNIGEAAHPPSVFMPTLFDEDIASSARTGSQSNDLRNGVQSFFFPGTASLSRRLGLLAPTVAYAIDLRDF